MQKQVERKFKIELMVTRHGQTVQNKKRIICGQNPGKLTQQGIHQAQKIGQHLKSQYFDKIYVSDLGRTKQTFQNIKLKAENLKNIQVKQKHGGILTGQPLITWQKQAAKQKKTIREYKCKDGQSWVDVNKRKIIRQNALQIQNPKLQQKILVVCHGGYIMLQVLKESKKQPLRTQLTTVRFTYLNYNIICNKIKNNINCKNQAQNAHQIILNNTQANDIQLKEFIYEELVKQLIGLNIFCNVILIFSTNSKKSKNNKIKPIYTIIY